MMRGKFVVLAVAGLLLAGSSRALGTPQQPLPGAEPTPTPLLVTKAPAMITFAGKQVTVPVGAEYRLDAGSLVIVLTESSKKDVAVVKIGGTFVVISRGVPLVIDPHGRPLARGRYVFTLPSLRDLNPNSINDAADASPNTP